MELSWSTFLLEILNFLILLWILKRFLYQPVLDVLARRQKAIEDRMNEAQCLKQEAMDLKDEYEKRLNAWEQQRREAKNRLNQDLADERRKKLNALQSELEQERKKTQVQEAKQQRRTIHEIEQKALLQGANFASRILNRTAGPELEARMLEILLDGFAALSDAQVKQLRGQWGERPERIQVSSVYPLEENQRQALEKQLARINDCEIPVDYQQDPALIAGMRISIGSWLLHADVQGDLAGFAEFAHVTH